MRTSLIAAIISLTAILPIYANQEVESDTTALTEKQIKRLEKQQRRDSIRATKPIWYSFMGGPSYTPEASLGVGGAVLASFSTNRNDSLLQRSFIPVGINMSLNGTLVIAGVTNLFFNQNKFRTYIKFSYRSEPTHYFGKGFDDIAQREKSSQMTAFHKTSFQLFPRFVWELSEGFFLGPLLDINYSKSTDINPLMAQDEYFLRYDSSYLNVGIGGQIQYDTRNDVATPRSGILLSGLYKNFGKYYGGEYNYHMLDLEYRQFFPLFNRRSVLALNVRTQSSWGDVPFTELPTFGSPFDLRGYLWGKYRDKSMAYGIAEYRHTFGSQESYDRGSFWAKTGFVAWIGTGTLGETAAQWNQWKLNYGAGLRFEIQPGKNFRLDFGKEPGVGGIAFYMNMTEAF